MRHPVPKLPLNLDPLAVEILDELRLRDESAQIILGGQFALKHYLDRRSTHDIDAWWPMDAGAEARQTLTAVLREVVERVADRHGLARAERTWGDVVSLELREGLGAEGKTVFSVQVARRSVELDPPALSPWPPIRIESLRDNLAAKMTALVSRGHPRDFIDIENVVGEQMATVADCWNLWLLRNPSGSISAAKASVLRHLEAITLRRPTVDLDPAERLVAETRRDWVRTELLGEIEIDELGG